MTEPSLEARLERLDAIAARLSSDDLELDEALQLFEEAVGQVRAAREQLRTAELRVEEMLGRAGSPTLRPLDADPG